MNKDEAIKLAKHYFKHNPKVNEFHFTSDGQAFDNISNARHHAKGLDDKAIVSVKRDELEADVAPEVSEEVASTKSKKK